MGDTVDWTSICFDPLLSEEICLYLSVDSGAVGFGNEELSVSLSEAALVLCIRNVVMHFVNFGFTNAEIDDAISLTVDCYKRLISPGNCSGLISDIEVFIDCVQNHASRFSSVKLTQLVDYLQKDLIQHENLYKFCAIGQRQSGARSFALTVDTPQKALPLKKGLKKDICEYEMKVNQLEAAEQQEKARLVQELTAKETAVESVTKQAIGEKLEEWLALESPNNKNILEIINAVAKQYASIINTRVVSAVESMDLELRYKFDKTAVPRPLKLGPPPRFKLKPPIQISKLDPSIGAAAVQPTMSGAKSPIPKHK